MSGTTRVRIKSRAAKSAFANPEVVGVFESVLGGGDAVASLPIAHPKWLAIDKHVRRYLTVLAMIARSRLLDTFPAASLLLRNYIEALERQYVESFKPVPDLTEYLEGGVMAGAGDAAAAVAAHLGDYGRVPPEVAKEWQTRYAAIKTCPLVGGILVTCRNLARHKAALENADNLKHHFLRNRAGTVFAPLAELPHFNFKQIYISDTLDASGRDFVMLILHKLYTTGHDVYEALSRPDIDVEEFVSVVTSALEDAKGQFPRCQNALRHISKSVDLLRTNFGTYYRDFTASGDASTILQNFVLDVANSPTTSTSPKLTREFRVIIEHFRKVARAAPANPRMAALLSQVDKSYNDLNRQLNKADASADAAVDSAVDDTVVDTALGTAEVLEAAVAADEAAIGSIKKSAAAKKRRRAKNRGARAAKAEEIESRAEGGLPADDASAVAHVLSQLPTNEAEDIMTRPPGEPIAKSKALVGVILDVFNEFPPELDERDEDAADEDAADEDAADEDAADEDAADENAANEDAADEDATDDAVAADEDSSSGDELEAPSVPMIDPAVDDTVDAESEGDAE